MLNIKNILCPIDLDDSSSISVLDYACELSEQNGATLHLLHVARTPFPDMDVPVPIGPHPHWEIEARGTLEKLARERLDDKVAFEVIVKGGIPESVILRLAADLKIDLIVMATHGRTGLAHFILGSVAETVIREAPCPVFTVRPQHHQSAPAAVKGRDSHSA